MNRYDTVGTQHVFLAGNQQVTKDFLICIPHPDLSLTLDMHCLHLPVLKLY